MKTLITAGKETTPRARISNLGQYGGTYSKGALIRGRII